MEIEFFQNESVDDTQLPLDFLDGLSDNVQARFHACLEHIEQHDGKIGGVAFRKLHSYPMEEIRIKESKNLHRLILQIKIKDCVHVLHGFTKKEGQKTPEKELKIAYQRLLTLIS